MTFDRDTKVGIVTDVYDKPQKGGIAYYIQRLVKALKEICPERLCLIHSRFSNDPLYEGVEEILYPFFSVKAYHDFPLIFKTSKIFERKKVNLLHLPSIRPSHLPFFLMKDFKYVITMHGLCFWQPVSKPRIFTMSLPKWVYYKLVVSSFPFIQKKVNKFIAVSDSVKNELINKLKVSQEKIEVIYEAPGEIFQPTRKNLLNSHLINYPYILSGDLNKEMITIFYQLKNLGIRHKLVILNNEQFTSYIEKLNLKKEIIFLGRVSPEILADLYPRASCFFNFSLYEGFGLMPLEAMASGCPVVSSNIASLPEVVGEGGILLSPKKKDEWVEKIYYILTHQDFRRDLIRKGLNQAKKFSWEKAAKETIKVYEEVLNEDSPGK